MSSEFASIIRFGLVLARAVFSTGKVILKNAQHACDKQQWYTPLYFPHKISGPPFAYTGVLVIFISNVLRNRARVFVAVAQGKNNSARKH